MQKIKIYIQWIDLKRVAYVINARESVIDGIIELARHSSVERMVIFDSDLRGYSFWHNGFRILRSYEKIKIESDKMMKKLQLKFENKEVY